MTISMIAAAGEKNTLGRKGKLLWHLPDDMKRFKRITSGHPVILGRKTFETLDKPLPNRTNIVLTRNLNFKAEGFLVAHNIKDALDLAKKQPGNEEICIIGGGEIYKLALPYANKIELTRIHHKFEGGDAFFPEFDETQWDLVKEVVYKVDERHKYSFTYQTFIRK